HRNCYRSFSDFLSQRNKGVHSKFPSAIPCQSLANPNPFAYLCKLKNYQKIDNCVIELFDIKSLKLMFYYK
ncbi:hypothetical protein, partial [Thermoflexibacter ruber]|uniref:hypothetical protein n=1 Tax=Thermoflexibacter ruber TaxID=1003 RepID=UPI001C87414B